MTIRIPTAGQNAACDAVVDRADLGAGAATIEIRSGSQPASANDAASGTLLATVTCADPAFGSSSSGSAALAGLPLSTTGSAAGTAGWFRIKESGGATALDGSVGTSGADMILNTTTISVGVAIQITATSQITMPGG